MNIMLLATAWGPRHGGINAFNRDFAEGLAHSLGANGRVFCAVLEPSEAETAEAAGCGVTLAPVTGKGTAETFDTAWTYEILAWLRKHHGAPSLSWWVGHDMTSGRAALAGPEAGGGGTALINHMSYIDYQGAKHDSASDADAKHRQQARCWASRRSRSAIIPDTSARFSCKALTTCGVAMPDDPSCSIHGRQDIRPGVRKAGSGGGGCYIMPRMTGWRHRITAVHHWPPAENGCSRSYTAFS